MSDAPHLTSRDRALNVGRGHVDRDGIAVREAMDGLEAGGSIEVYAILNGLLRSTISIMELTGRPWTLGDLVGRADELAASAPPHYEFAVGEATRASASGDHRARRRSVHRRLTLTSGRADHRRSACVGSGDPPYQIRPSAPQPRGGEPDRGPNRTRLMDLSAATARALTDAPSPPSWQALRRTIPGTRRGRPRRACCSSRTRSWRRPVTGHSPGARTGPPDGTGRVTGQPPVPGSEVLPGASWHVPDLDVPSCPRSSTTI